MAEYLERLENNLAYGSVIEHLHRQSVRIVYKQLIQLR